MNTLLGASRSPFSLFGINLRAATAAAALRRYGFSPWHDAAPYMTRDTAAAAARRASGTLGVDAHGG